MSSARRRAQRARAGVPAESAGFAIPPELLDPHAEVWHDQAAYHRYMREQGWSLPCSERFGVATHPANRRNETAGQWAMEHGVTSGGFADLHRLRSIGVYSQGGK